jgi:uncharacterized protein
MGKKVKVVFDSNVWLSIFMKKVLSQEFSDLLKKEIIVYITEDILTEIARALTYPKIIEALKDAGIHQREILRAIEANSTVVNPSLKLYVIDEDPEDNKIIECAQASSANVIVTGDKHLLKMGKFKKTIILRPREFLEKFSCSRS